MLTRIARVVRCLVSGHSRYMTFSYLYQPGGAVDASVVCRCGRCRRVVRSRTVDGVVTVLGRMERAP